MHQHLQLKVEGVGAFIGLQKVHNSGEHASSATVNDVSEITYIVADLTATSMTLQINYGGGWWQYKLVKE